MRAHRPADMSGELRHSPSFRIPECLLLPAAGDEQERGADGILLDLRQQQMEDAVRLKEVGAQRMPVHAVVCDELTPVEHGAEWRRQHDPERRVRLRPISLVRPLGPGPRIDVEPPALRAVKRLDAAVQQEDLRPPEGFADPPDSAVPSLRAERGVVNRWDAVLDHRIPSRHGQGAAASARRRSSARLPVPVLR
jgi:hypothetical protein